MNTPFFKINWDVLYEERREHLYHDFHQLYEKEYGFIVYKAFNGKCFIDYIEIDKTNKREGYGTLLLNEFLSDFKNKGYKSFFLEAVVTSKTIFTMEELTRFYNKFGFIKYNEVFDDRLRILMSLEIK